MKAWEFICLGTGWRKAGGGFGCRRVHRRVDERWGRVIRDLRNIPRVTALAKLWFFKWSQYSENFSQYNFSFLSLFLSSLVGDLIQSSKTHHERLSWLWCLQNPYNLELESASDMVCLPRPEFNHLGHSNKTSHASFKNKQLWASQNPW